MDIYEVNGSTTFLWFANTVLVGTDLLCTTLLRKTQTGECA